MRLPMSFLHHVLVYLILLCYVVQSKPNFLILLADDLGYGDLGCYGNRSVETPNIDSIARGGVKMTQHLTTASTCTPSRAALLTGRLPIRTDCFCKWLPIPSLRAFLESGPLGLSLISLTGVVIASGMAPTGIMRVNLFPTASSGLPDSEITFAEQTRTAGYTNAFIGKWHLGHHRDRYGDNIHHPLNQGFDYFYGTIGTNLEDFGPDKKVITCYLPTWYWILSGSAMTVFITLWFMMKAGFISGTTLIVLFSLALIPILAVYLLLENLELLASFVHLNYDVVEQPIQLPGFSQRLAREGLEFMKNATDSGKPFLVVMSWLHMHVAIKTGEKFKGRSKLGRFGDGLLELDWSVGEMLKGLKALGVDDNTLVYFSSDNGGHLELGEHGGYNGHLKGGKSHGAPDGGIRVAGMLMWPGHLKPGTVTDEPTSQLDVFPLISQLAGVSIPTDRQYDGQDILPLLQQLTDVSPHRFLFHYCGNKLHAVRYRPTHGKSTWKYVTREPILLPGQPTCQFICSCNRAITLTTSKIYDMTSDPGETTPIDSSSDEFSALSSIFIEAIQNHERSLTLDPVETQFIWYKLLPNLHWQPCCNGIFPFNCQCKDPKYQL